MNSTASNIGSRSGELVPEIGENEQAAGYIKDKDGKYVTSRLDEDMLSKIAAKTGGGYLRADAQHFGVEAIEAALAGLKRTESDTRLVKQYDEVFEYLLLPALLLLLIEICISERRHERKKAGKQGSKQGSKMDGAQAAGVLMLLLPFLGAWNPIERNNRAVESGNASMKNGKAEEALADYDKAVAELPNDAGAHFNRGNALFALSRFEEASAEFLRATQATEPGLKASAFYNLANSYFKNDKYSESIAAYRHALALDPSNGRAKWNLELALQKKKEEDKKKEDDKNKQDQNKDDKKDQQQQVAQPQPRHLQFGGLGRSGMGVVGLERAQHVAAVDAVAAGELFDGARGIADEFEPLPLSDGADFVEQYVQEGGIPILAEKRLFGGDNLRFKVVD